ncbi:hypothetical protein WJX72_007888 [[Myrmecia] bisecta]|uniref:Uncharacterized protein n=1 Tax=[Myrmecia] bisecta TaxID=41462 RepID=A0AAW1PX94_9CHLO
MQNPPNIQAAFVYLVKAGEEHLLATSLLLLQQRFLRKWPYPVLVFLDDTASAYQLLHFHVAIPAGVQAHFVRLHDFSRFPEGFPEGFDSSHYGRMVHTNRDFPSYNHMIRFWWRQVFHHPIVRELDYYVRMDTDSFILSDIDYDFIYSMQQDGLTYGYVAEGFDGPEFTTGLFDFVADYLDSHVAARELAFRNNLWLPDPEDRDKHGPHLFYNNFEVVSVQRLISNAQYMEFVDAVDQSYNIYWYRWGDAPLRFYAAKLALQYDMEVRILCGIDYYHQGRLDRTC